MPQHPEISTTPFPEEEQFVAIVIAVMGDRKYKIMNAFGSSYLSHDRRSLSQNLYVNDIVLANDFSYDILYKYTPSDIKQLVKDDVIDYSFLNRKIRPSYAMDPMSRPIAGSVEHKMYDPAFFERHGL